MRVARMCTEVGANAAAMSVPMRTRPPKPIKGGKRFSAYGSLKPHFTAGATAVSAWNRPLKSVQVAVRF